MQHATLNPNNDTSRFNASGVFQATLAVLIVVVGLATGRFLNTTLLRQVNGLSEIGVWMMGMALSTIVLSLLSCMLTKRALWGGVIAGQLFLVGGIGMMLVL